MMALGNMRENGVRSLAITCGARERMRWGKQIALGANCVGATRVPKLPPDCAWG